MTDQQTAADNALVERLEARSDGEAYGGRTVFAQELHEAAERIKSLQAEVERMRPWYLFYAEGKNLGEVAEACGGTIYNYSPWLTAPLVRAAIRSSEKDVK